MAETNSKYTKEITTDFVKLGKMPSDPTDEQKLIEYVTELEGTLDTIDSQIMQGKPVGKYTMTLESGRVVEFLGSVILDGKLNHPEVEIGADMRIEMTGSQKSATAGHSPTKQFKVLLAE